LVASEPIGDDVVMSVPMVELDVPMSVPMLEPVPMSVLIVEVEVSVLVEVDIVVSVVVAGVSSSVSSFLHPANGIRRKASRQRSERRTDSFFIVFSPLLNGTD
jgi:hypothetical protein